MSYDFNEALSNVKDCMRNAGDIVFNGVSLKSVTLDQLRPNEDNIVEHWKIYQGATAYYTYLLNQALTALEENEDALRREMLLVQAQCVRLAKTKYNLSRPTKDDLLIIAVLEGNEKIGSLKDAVRYFQDAVRHLQSWVDSWEKKSFCLNGITQAKGVNDSVLRSPRVPD